MRCVRECLALCNAQAGFVCCGGRFSLFKGRRLESKFLYEDNGCIIVSNFVGSGNEHFICNGLVLVIMDGFDV